MKIISNIRVFRVVRIALIWTLLFISMGSLLSGCFSGSVAYSEPVGNKGKIDSNAIVTKLMGYSTDSSLVICGLRSDDIYFSGNPTSNSPVGSLAIEISIIDHNNQPIHTHKTSRSFSRTDVLGPYYISELKVPLNPGEYVMKINILDNNSNRSYTNTTRIFKPEGRTFENEISLRWHDSEFIMAECPVGAELSLHAKAETVSITYFSQMPLPPAPFSSEKPTTPNKWKPEATTQAILHEGMSKLIPAGRGLYLFNISGNEENARMALATAPYFPEVRKIEELILSARYIMTKAEFDEIVNAKDVKKRFDTFWLTNSGSKEKARSMIRTYYNRVITANKMFTCHKEGWQTDRGMIFIVLGPPMETVQDTEKEIWTYPRSGLPGNDRFVFMKTAMPYNYNDFELVRNQEFKPLWMANVESWRTGKLN